MQGELILQRSRCKEEQQADFLRPLQQAELQHKHHRDPEALKWLTELWDLFAHLLDSKVSRQLCYLSHKFYEHGNKCGMMPGRALYKRWAQAHVHKL